MNRFPKREPSVAFSPEPMAALQARSRAALLDQYDPDVLRDKGGPYPSSISKHVFDTEDGVRLIISRELNPFVQEVIHVSASCEPTGTTAWTTLKTRGRRPSAKFQSATEAKQYINDKVQEITGLSLTHIAMTVSSAGVPHIFYKWDDAFLEEKKP